MSRICAWLSGLGDALGDAELVPDPAGLTVATGDGEGVEGVTCPVNGGMPAMAAASNATAPSRTTAATTAPSGGRREGGRDGLAVVASMEGRCGGAGGSTVGRSYRVAVS